MKNTLSDIAYNFVEKYMDYFYFGAYD